MIGRFSNYFPSFALLTLLSAVAVIIIATGRAKSAYKIAWIILITLFPIFGGLFYLVLGKTRLSRRMRRKMEDQAAWGKVPRASESVLHELQEMDQRGGTSPLHQNHAAIQFTGMSTPFYPLGDLAFPAMLEELEKASASSFWSTTLSMKARCGSPF